jgi:glycosyltransferase involved in cell wall biosynthesis
VNIRVAYDISFLGKFFDRSDEQSGVFRVVEELLTALSQREDVDLTAIALCGDDPLVDSVNSLLYLERRANKVNCNFRHSFRSRLRLERLYTNVFRAFASGEANNLSSYSLRAIWLRRMRGLLYRLAYSYELDELRHALSPDDFDVFHSPFSRLPPRELTGRLPRVLTIYDLIFINQPQFMSREIIGFLEKIFESIDFERDWFTSISEFTKNEFCEYARISPDRVFVTPLAAAAHFRPVNDPAVVCAARKRYGMPEGDYILSLAAIQPRKNLAHLIRCFFRLLAEHPSLDLNLVLVGKASWIFDEVFSAAEASPKSRSRIVFTGYIPDEDLSAVYSGALAFVFPSLYEGFGLPPLEAMQCGTPVITSNNTAFPEVVGDAGLMVDPMDADALCQTILTLVRDGALRQRLSLRGLERSQKFSWASCAEGTVAAYRVAAGID